MATRCQQKAQVSGTIGNQRSLVDMAGHGLITRRSQVQILPSQLDENPCLGGGSLVLRKGYQRTLELLSVRKAAPVEPVGVEVPIVWRGRRARAFVPTRLDVRDLELDSETVALAARAQAAVEHAAETMPQEYAALARLLLRAEGLASSFIEGVAAPVVDIVLAEAGEERGSPAAAWVAANLAAVTEAIEEAHAGPLTVESLCRWHRTLMTGSPAPAHQVGVLRTEQGWIGGTSPLDAHLVTPPPEEVPALVDDVIGFVNRDDFDAVTQAAVAHAQFEIIHPFADGNGRIGRVLVAWLLVRRLALVTPPPVSTRIAADVGGYSSGLVLFRMGDHNAWVRWFAEAVSGAGRAQRELVASVDRLQHEWRDRLAAPRQGTKRLRSNAAAWHVLDLLPRHLVLTGSVLASELSIPLKSANAALRDLADAGILVEHGTVQPNARGRPSRLYTSRELLGLTGSNPFRA